MSAETYTQLLHRGIPGLTSDRLDYLCERARSDDELADWLHPRHGRDAVDVALRRAHQAAGRRLHEYDRGVTALVVPLRVTRRDKPLGSTVTMRDIGVYEHDELPLLWQHDDKIGTVVRARTDTQGVRIWATIDPGPEGDEILRGVGFGEIGASVGIDPGTLAVRGVPDHLYVDGDAQEISLVPLSRAALGTETIATRAPIPASPPRTTATTRTASTPRSAAPASPTQYRSWAGQRLTLSPRR